MLASTLTTLRDERYTVEEIVVLSACNADKCCAAYLSSSSWKGRIRSYETSTRAIRYCSIHRFKGLEAPCIIITDIEKLGDAERASLLYVALTRAVNKVVILAHESVRLEIKTLLIGGR